MTVEDVIVLRGGRIAYSCTVDSTPRADEDRAGPTIARTRRRCGRCGERGHMTPRCNGKGQPPQPLERETRRERRRRAAEDNAERDKEPAFVGSVDEFEQMLGSES